MFKPNSLAKKGTLSSSREIIARDSADTTDFHGFNPATERNMMFRKLLRSIKLLLPVLATLVLGLPADCAVLDLSVKDTDASPAAGVIFQIFPGRVDVDDDVMPLLLGRPSSDGRDNDGDGEIDEATEDFAGYATDADGRLRLDLKDGSYTLVGFSQERHFLFVEEVSVPGSLAISAANTVPVSINCRAADGSPIVGAEVFFRPTMRARASVGYSDNSGLLKAYISDGEYQAVLWSNTGPYYLILPHQTVSPPDEEVNFHIAEIPTGELHFDLPKGTTIAICEVLESTYTREYAEGTEPEIGYDAAYTDFYPFITTEYPYTLSAGIDYNFSMSFAVMFGLATIYAYELRPAIHSIKPGIQHTGITENESFTLRVRADRGDKDPIYHPGDRVVLRYYFTDSRGNLLSRILNFGGARLILPMVTVWNPDKVPIANNFDTESFFMFSFDLPLSARLGKYRADITLDAGMYGKITGEFPFYVRADSDSEPPQITSLDFPEEFEAGEDLVIRATISDNVGLAADPELRISMDAGASWIEIPMAPDGGDSYQAVVMWDLIAQEIPPNPPLPKQDFTVAELNWQIEAQDLAGNSVEAKGITNVIDTSPPVITHEPFAIAELGRELRIQAHIKDNVATAKAVLLHIATGEDVRSTRMSGIEEAYSASIPASEITFDGVSYYIRATDIVGSVAFLPVGTDATEFAHVTVKDTIAPVISHSPVKVGIANTPVRIEAIVTDNSGMIEATLFYKSALDQEYRSIGMDTRGEIYFAEIPAEAVSPEGVQYHITASDGADPDGNVRLSVSPADGSDYPVEVRSGPHGALARLEISPSASQESPLDIVVGESVRFTAIGRGEMDEPLPVEVTWTAIGGIGHIDQDGSFLATGRIAGDGIGKIVATARHTGVYDAILQAEAWIRISPGPPTHIILSPSSTTIAAGHSQRFFATVTDVYYNPVLAEIDWSIDAEEQIGTIDDGVFSGLKVGSGHIVTEANDIRAVSDVVVMPGQLRKIMISSSSEFPGQVAAGNTVQFTAEGYDVFGNHILIAPVWSVRGGIGTIRGDGLFRGGIAGSGQVAATVGDVSAAVDVEVVPGQLHSISVSPYTVYLPVSTDEYPSTQQFIADGRDAAGNPVPLKKLSWTTDVLAGSISASGLFTAITDPGVRTGEVVINGTIWANGASATGKQVTGAGYVVIQKSPASRLSSISVFMQGASSDLGGVSIATGESVQLEAVGSDVKARKLLINPSWSVEGGIGNINVNGSFTAMRPGSGAVVATASGLTGRIQVEVTSGPLNSIAIKPDMLVLIPGAQRSLTAVGYDSFENVVPLHNIRWSVEGDAVTIEPTNTSCMVTALDTRWEHPASSNSIVSVRVGDLVGFANIFAPSASISGISDKSTGARGNLIPEDYSLIPNDVPYYLEIEPDLISVMAGSQQQFSARAIDVLGKEFDSDNLSWSAAGDIGEISSFGLFTAGDKPGSGRIIVTDGRVFGIAIVTVLASVAQVQELLIMPSQVSLTAGTVQKFTAFAVVNGELVLILPAWKTIGSIGSVDAAGRFAATTVGEGEVEASMGGLPARGRVTVSAGKPARIEIQPNSLSTRVGEQKKFSVVCRDEMGNLLSSSPAFQITGNLGNIGGNGLFTAQEAGAGSVIAVVSVDAQHAAPLLISEAVVDVLPGSLTTIEVLPEDQEVSAGSSVRFFAIGKDTYGNMTPVDPAWDILGPADMGSISSNGLFIADRVGQGQILAKAGEITGTASIEVHPATPASILVEPDLISVSSQATDAKQFSFRFLDLRGNVVEEMADVEPSWAVTTGIGSIDPQTGLFMHETGLHEPRTGYVTAAAVINMGSKLERAIRGRAAVILYPVAKPLAIITITPDSVLVIRGDNQEFSAVGRDADGTEVEVHPIWRIVSDDGRLEIPNAISADGMFSATPEMGVGFSWKVLASVLNSEGQTVQGEAALSLITGPLQSIEVACKDDACIAPVESGQIVEVLAAGYDQFRNEVEISPDWRATGGIGTLESPVAGARSKAALTAGHAGSGEVIAEAEGKEGKLHITVVPGQLVDISISTDPAPADESIGRSEASPLILTAGSDIRFAANGRDSDVDILGRAKPVNFLHVSPQWSVKSSEEEVNLGTISSDGRFVGREAGAGRIEAEAGSVIGSFYIEVVAGDLASISVFPSLVSVISEEDSKQQFSASGYDLYGNQIAGLAKLIWQATGDIGNIDEDGLFTPASLPPGGTAISGTVIASYGNVQGSASVTVVSALGKLSALSVTIEPSIVQAGGQATCVIRGTDEFGNPISLSVYKPISLFSVSVPARLGTVIPSDELSKWIFRAGKNLPSDPDQRTGLLNVTAEVDGKTFSGDVPLTLIPGPLSKLIVEPAGISLLAGEKQRFEASGYDSWGNETDTPTPEWTVSGNIGQVVRGIDNPQEAVFTAITAGRGQLIASSPPFEGQTDLTVLPGKLETLTIEPKEVTIAAGTSHRFSGVGKDSYGNEIETLKLHWQLFGNTSIGSVTQDGLFSAVKVGDGKLKAVYEDVAGMEVSDEASITVVPDSIASVTIVIYKEGKMLEPPFTFLSGVRYDLHVRGVDLWGNEISRPEEATWNIAGDIGLISSIQHPVSAVLTTLFPGRGQIMATVGRISTYVEVQVVPHSQNVTSRKGASISGPFEASINIPPDALRTDETISIALAPAPPLPSPRMRGDTEQEPAKRIGHVYSFQPDGTVFKTPVELTLPYSGSAGILPASSKIDREKLILYSWDRFQTRWIRVGGVADPYQKSVTAVVNYLSLFTIMQEEPGIYDEPTSDDLSIFDVRLSPNTYFAPEINRLTIHYNIGCAPHQPVDVTIEIYDIRGHLVKELLVRSPKYPGWNTDQWDGTDETGEIAKNGRYFLYITAETDRDKVTKTKHLAVFK